MRFVRVVLRRVVWAARAEIWDCVWVAMDEMVGVGFEAVEGRVLFRYVVGEKVGERKGTRIGSVIWGLRGREACMMEAHYRMGCFGAFSPTFDRFFLSYFSFGG